MNLTIQQIDRFWSKVNKTNDCWNWTGFLDADGYGSFGYAPEPNKWKPIQAHRISVLLDGRDPTGKIVCHHCDNPSCVRPDHLFLGTHQDNRNDCLSKDRAGHKLKAIDVEYIRKNTIIGPRGAGSHKISNVREIADKFNIQPETIRNIVNRKIWTHI